jgi:hypothetical protein
MSKDIYEAINNVMKQVGYVQKEKNDNLRYSFASESALIAALRPFMVAEGIVALPISYDNIEKEIYTTGERQTKMNNISLTGHFRLIHAPSGTSVDISTRGEGADSGDKANNKAMTGAFKYFIRQSFMIETGDDPDMYQDNDRRVETSGAIAGASAAVQQAIPKIWTMEQFSTLFAEKIFANQFEAKSVLDRAKGINPATPLKGILFWCKQYRQTRESDPKLTVEECIAQADYDYSQEIARMKAEAK